VTEPAIGAGVLRFSRYAYPPNALGYCGPDAGATMLEHAAAGESDGGLVQLARGFEGAWPYLELIAEAAGIEDPLDDRVVRAYWLGGELLERAGGGRLHRFLEDRFRPSAGSGWEDLSELARAGAVPHHNLHVFGVYPWVGLMRLGHTEEPLRVLEGCRIRWGRIVAVEGPRAVVRSRGLRWDGGRLSLGAPRLEEAVLADNGHSLVAGSGPGDWVSLHWGWVCERLSEGERRRLREATLGALAAVNATARPGPARVLG